jgi:GAF domain-containing protein
MNMSNLRLSLRDPSDINARFALTLSIATASVTLVSTVISLLLAFATGQYITLAANVVVVVLAVSSTILVLRGYIRHAAVLLIITYTAGALGSSIANPLLAALALIAAATLANPTAFVIVNLIVLGRVGLEAIIFTALNTHAITTGVLNLDAYVSPLFSLTLLSLVTRYFITITQNTAQKAQRSAELLQASADIGQAASRLLDSRDLLNQTSNLMASRFNYYIVRIYQVNDAGTELVLSADSGETRTQRPETRRHAVNAQLAVGQAVLRARYTIVRFGDQGFTREDWELHTRSQLALPLLSRDRVIGVVDIQSRDDDAFSSNDLQALLVVTEVLSSALGNARLFEAQRQTAEENQSLYESAQANLREIQRLNQELTGQVWDSYTQQGELGVTLQQTSLSTKADWTEGLKRASEARQAIVHQTDESEPVVAVPLLLRGEVIGAIEVQPNQNTHPSETLEMVEAVAQRLAVSLENARLYEETTAAAAHEQRINDIAARYQEVTTVDELLRITVTELSESLGAESGAIRLSRVKPEGERDAG